MQLKPNQTWQKIISRVQKEKRSSFLSVIRLICAWNVSLKKVVCFGKAGFLSRISVPIMWGYPLLLWQGLWSVNSVGEKGIGILITSTCGPSAQLYPCLGKRPTAKGFLNTTYVCIFRKGWGEDRGSKMEIKSGFIIVFLLSLFPIWKILPLHIWILQTLAPSSTFTIFIFSIMML